jgi:xanthine/uracil permease
MASQICRFCLVNRLCGTSCPQKTKEMETLLTMGIIGSGLFCLVQVVAAGGIGFTIFGNKYH